MGYTNNLEKRIEQHKSGRVKSTKHRAPFQMLFSESFSTQKEAKKRELWWKSGAGRRKMAQFYKQNN